MIIVLARGTPCDRDAARPRQGRRRVFDAEILAAAYGIPLEIVRGDGGLVIAPR